MSDVTAATVDHGRMERCPDELTFNSPDSRIALGVACALRAGHDGPHMARKPGDEAVKIEWSRDG